MFISTTLVYKYYEKENWKVSALAGLFVFLFSIVTGWILSLLGMDTNLAANLSLSNIGLAFLFSLTVSVLTAWVITSKKISFLKNYKTKNPWKTAIIIVVVDLILSFILLGILATAILAILGVSASNASLLV